MGDPSVSHLHHQLAFFATGSVGDAVASGGSSLWIPGGLLLTACELLRRAAITYKEARQVDVDGARQREEAARQREAGAQAELVEAHRQRDDIRADRDSQIEELRVEVGRLRNEVGDLKGSHRKSLRDLEERHSNELQAVHRRLEKEIRVTYRIREYAATKGLALPDDLLSEDHARPEEGP